MVKGVKGKEYVCMWCGCSDCKCSTWCIVTGILFVLIGILLWVNVISLNVTVALFLIITGIWCSLFGAHYRKK